MDDRTYTFEDIAAYLAGELPSGEQEAFDQQVAKDQELAARVDQQRLTHQAVDLYTQLRTKEEIRAIYQGGAKVRRLPNRSLLAVAASVAILLLAGFWWQRSQYRSPALAGQYFTAYPDRLTTMSGDTEADLAAAMDAYNASDYERALALFQALPAELPQAGLIRLYTGIAQLRTGDAAAAHTSLEGIPADSPYLEAARWYLALSELALGQDDRARQRLEAIVAEGAYPGPPAEALLEDLDSWWH